MSKEESDSDEEGELDYGHVDSTGRDGNAHNPEEQEVAEVGEESEVEAHQQSEEQSSHVTGVEEIQHQDLGAPEGLPDGDDEDEELAVVDVTSSPSGQDMISLPSTVTVEPVDLDGCTHDAEPDNIDHNNTDASTPDEEPEIVGGGDTVEVPGQEATFEEWSMWLNIRLNRNFLHQIVIDQYLSQGFQPEKGDHLLIRGIIMSSRCLYIVVYCVYIVRIFII